MRHEIVTVTPELASEWLSKPSPRQRSAARTTVATYARAMSEGRWIEPTTDPIAFTADGLLLNGQHRLLAVIRSGVTLEMLIALEVAEALFGVIDQGRKRQAPQFIRRPSANQIGTTARIILWYDHRRMSNPAAPMNPVGIGAMAFDNDEILALVESPFGDVIEESVRLAGPAYKAATIPLSQHAAVLAIARRDGADGERLQEWLDGLVSGAGLSANDPRPRLRQRMTDIHGPHLRRSVPATWMLIVRAFNAFMQARTLGVLRYEADDPPPAIDVVGTVSNREGHARRRVPSPIGDGTTNVPFGETFEERRIRLVRERVAKSQGLGARA